LNGLPPGLTPQYISSSDGLDLNAKRGTRNTGVRRTSLSRQSLIAKATRASGDVMAGQMREMAEAS
jgi:hypothetical protein